MKIIIKFFLIYFFIFISFTLFYLLSFHTPLFLSQSVLFYRGLLLLILISFVFLIMMLVINKKLKINLETLIAVILISVSINLIFFVVFPVTFERSVTMFLLNTLKNNSDNSCYGLTKLDLEKKLINDYVIKRRAIDKRVNEQEIIGFIKEKNNCFSLTSKADKFLKLSEIIGRFYNLK